MERRSFVKGAFGLAVIAVGAGVGAITTNLDKAANAPLFLTPDLPAELNAIGPVMQPGIELMQTDDGVAGFLGETKLFSADATAATLIMLADGSRTLEGITRESAATLGTVLDQADVASFFVELGQAGFLQNEVYVNLFQVSS